MLNFGPDARFGTAHWKLGPIGEYAEGRPLAWIDDSLSEECHALGGGARGADAAGADGLRPWNRGGPRGGAEALGRGWIHPVLNVAIAGGHGKIALLLSELLAERGDRVSALIRNPDHREDVRAAGAEPVLCDLEQEDEGIIAEAIEGCEAVVFAAGAGPDSGVERKETVDYEGAVKLLEAAEMVGVRRYVMVSAMAADPEHEGEEVFDVYLRAKGRADAAVEAARISHAIVRPGMLTDDRSTGKVEAGPRVGRAKISRADVAAVLLACLGERWPEGKSFDVVEGEMPIEAAIAAL